MAAACEPNGSLVLLRGGEARQRVEGYARGMNDRTAIVGAGELLGGSGAWRPFRSHWQKGFSS